MPFAVFRRHQKKLLAVFAIMAMVAFVLSDSLNKSISRNNARSGDRVVVDLFGKPVRSSELQEFAQMRGVANRFIMIASGGADQVPFGGYTTRELVDGLILKHEADRLGIPEGSDFAREWLKRQSRGQMTRQLFESILRDLGGEVTGEQTLTCLASQIRLVQARVMLGQPLITPLDVFDSYRDQNERSSFKMVSFPATNYLDKVGEPSESDIETLYTSYKGTLPDPNRDTPGFKIPREIKVEVVSIDGAAVAKGIREKLTETELKTYYESRKDQFTRPNEFPPDIFKDDEKGLLTPPQYLPFAEVKDALAEALSRERAGEQISDKLEKFRADVIDKFSDEYHDAVSDNADAKKNGEKETATVPTASSLADAAKAAGLNHEITPLLSYDLAKNYGRLGTASVGLNPETPGELKFADAIFAPKSPLFDGMDFSEPSGFRYVVRKLEDLEPHIAPLPEVKPQVIAAWKLARARELAEKAAKELAEATKKDGGKFKEAVVGGRPVVPVDSVSRMVMGMPIPGRGLQFAPPAKSELHEIPKASDELRDAMFSLKTGEVAVGSDLPKSTYYVVTLDKRDPATFSGLYGLTGMPMLYQSDAMRKAFEDDGDHRMAGLRAKAGITPDWVPNDEKERQAAGGAG